MWKLLVLCLIISVMSDTEAGNGKAARQSRRRRAYAGGYGGYGGSYANSASAGNAYDYDDYGDYYGGPFVGAGFIDPYTFHQQLTNQILAQNQATQQAITALVTNGIASASADAAIYSTSDDNRIQSQIADNFRRQGHYKPGTGAGSSAYNSNRYAPNYSVASGSIGPGGYHQTAYINPANPAIPNIVNRFGATSSTGGGSGGGGGGGYKGVSVSSFSSSNSDGTNRRGAQTTINDNGKITSYSVHS